MNTHPILKVLFASGMIVGLLSSYAPAQDTVRFLVIVSPNVQVTTLSKKEISWYFLKKSTTWPNDGKVLVVDQIPNAPVRNAFSIAIHGRTVSAIKAYWTQAIFSGRGVPPQEKLSDAAVVEFVSANKGAIGYVSIGTNIGKTKIITVTN